MSALTMELKIRGGNGQAAGSLAEVFGDKSAAVRKAVRKIEKAAQKAIDKVKDAAEQGFAPQEVRSIG